jgi:hypothetical protein
MCAPTVLTALEVHPKKTSLEAHVLTCSACSFATSPAQFDLDYWQNKRNILNQAIPGLTAQGMLDPASRFSKNSGEIGTGHFCVLRSSTFGHVQYTDMLGDVLHVPSTCDRFEAKTRKHVFWAPSPSDQTRSDQTSFCCVVAFVAAGSSIHAKVC